MLPSVRPEPVVVAGDNFPSVELSVVEAEVDSVPLLPVVVGIGVVSAFVEEESVGAVEFEQFGGESVALLLG